MKKSLILKTAAIFSLVFSINLNSINIPYSLLLAAPHAYLYCTKVSKPELQKMMLISAGLASAKFVYPYMKKLISGNPKPAGTAATAKPSTQAASNATSTLSSLSSNIQAPSAVRSQISVLTDNSQVSITATNSQNQSTQGAAYRPTVTAASSNLDKKIKLAKAALVVLSGAGLYHFMNN